MTKTVTESPSSNTGGYDESYSHSFRDVRSEHQTKVLTGISLSGFTAAFSYASVSSHSGHTVISGTDADNYPKRLTGVTVANPTGELILRAATSTGRHPHDGRIILEGVTLYGKDGTTAEDRWTFSYRTASHAVSRYSQDWYGYFNGENGARMTTDAGAGLSIAYNAFDLPERISQGTALKVKYTYMADGTKVSALDASGAGLVYRGPFTYRRTSGGTLSFESAPFDRGRLTEAGARYHVTDHLGSVRAVINGNASTTTYPLSGFYSVDDFAPFGTKSTSSASSYISLASTGTTVSLRDGFTGQEDQMPDFSVGYIDFGARQYSTALSRWLVPDPLGEKYYNVSPYAYCAGDPVNLVDPEGKDIWEFDESGRIVSHTRNTDADSFYLVEKDESGNYARAFSYGSNGEIQFRSISFEYKTILNYGFVDGTGFSFKVNSNYKGNELFKFLADNSKSEMGVVNTLEEVSYVMSDLKTNSVNVTGLAMKLDKAGMTVTNILHSHPLNTGASGYNKNDLKGDRFAAMAFPMSHGYVVDHLIYRPKTEDLILFTKDKSGRLTTWDMWNLK